MRLWSVETARMIVKLEGFRWGHCKYQQLFSSKSATVRGWVRALAWTNDGSRLAAACNDSDVCVLRFAEGFFVTT